MIPAGLRRVSIAVWETFYDSNKDKRGIVPSRAGTLKYWELLCIARKAAVERDEALVALTPKPERLCLGNLDAPCNTACWKKQLVNDRKGMAEACAQYLNIKS